MRDDVKQWLDQFDKGKPVHTLEMGGLGPGYEQALQLLAIELVRAEATSKEDINKVVERVNTKLGGLSGAQVGAASWLAQYILEFGVEKLLTEAKNKGDSGRCIMVSNSWPSLK